MADEKPDGSQDKTDVTPEKKYSKAELDLVIQERDKAKEKLRKYDEDKKKAEEAKAIEEGKLKEVLTLKEQELLELRKKADAFEAQQIKLRESIINKLSTEDQELVADIKDLDKLQKFVEKLSKQPQPPDPKNQLGGANQKPKFNNAQENAKWLLENGLAV